MGKTCCVTGHRDLPAGGRDKNPIRTSQGDSHSYQGRLYPLHQRICPGADLMFAEIVVELKDRYPITLEAAIPYPGRMKTPDEAFRRLIGCCDVVKIHSDHYFKGCYMVRNRYMVDASQLVIAIWNGRESGGTAATVQYAERCGRKIEIIRVSLTEP